MPYYNEKANKFSHERIINNQAIKNVLNNYEIVFDIKDKEADYGDIKRRFIENINEDDRKIDYIFTVDSSFMEIPVNEEIPTAKVGIINFSSSIIDLKKKSQVYEKGFINPKKFNDIYNSKMLTFICPTYNVILKNNNNMNEIDCIRKEIYNFYLSNKPFSNVKLIDTLFNVMESNIKDFKLKCTSDKCKDLASTQSKQQGMHEFILKDIGIEPFECPCCGNTMYLTDYLRIHEAVDVEFGNSNILTRFAQVTEHLININAIDSFRKHKSFSILLRTAFIIDGPLAIYGEPAKINKSILKYLHGISKIIGEELVYFGILKTGKLKDHFSLLLKKFKSEDRKIPRNSFLLVDDDYRFKYIQKAPRENKFFGQEVLFGQDYLFHSKEGKKFVVSMIYPIESRDKYFGEKVFDYNNYKNINTVFNLINNISLDLYEDATLPIALAHKYAAISLNPGTNILELFIRKNLN